MSKYVENNLQNGETVVAKAKINFLAAFANILWAIICIAADIVIAVTLGGSENEGSGMVVLIIDIAIALIGLLPLIVKIIKLAFTELAVTNKRVIGKVGIVAMKSLDLPINKVETVSIQSTFWGRIFRFSTIVIKSASGDDDGLLWKGITNANEMKNTITAAIEKNADEARKAQAAEIAAAMGKKG